MFHGLERNLQKTESTATHMRVVLQVLVYGLYKIGNVIGFKGSAKDRIKQARKENTHTHTYYVCVCVPIHMCIYIYMYA